MHDVDVHIIHFNEPRWMLARCIASLEGQPVNIHLIKGEKEFPPYEGRKKGFASGTAEYCSFVDPDDVVLPGAFEELLQHRGHDLVWGNEEVITEDKVDILKYPHHAYIVKRDLDIQHHQEFRAVVKAPITKYHVDKILYTWNFYLGTKNRRMNELRRT